MNLKMMSFSESHIDARIREDDGKEWRATGFYGNWDSAKRHESWDLLLHLNSQFAGLWLCFGDFNEILANKEKKGGNKKPDSLLTRFRDALAACDLFDCGFSRYPFTWANNQ